MSPYAKAVGYTPTGDGPLTVDDDCATQFRVQVRTPHGTVSHPATARVEAKTLADRLNVAHAMGAYENQKQIRLLLGVDS